MSVVTSNSLELEVTTDMTLKAASELFFDW